MFLHDCPEIKKDDLVGYYCSKDLCTGDQCPVSDFHSCSIYLKFNLKDENFKELILEEEE